MQDNKIKKDTYRFVFFLLLAGFIHIFDDSTIIGDRFVRTFLFSAVFIIYIGLLIFWIQSVRQRLLPTGARTYMITAVLFMMLLLMLRAVKYRISAGVIMDRYCWYAYYFPIVMIPTLFLLACISINKWT